MTPSQQVDLTSLEQAAKTLAGVTTPTPLIRLPLSGDVFAKPESLQRTGSFKLRGAYHFLANLPDEVRRRGVVAHSSGNHAQGVACAARLFGVHATIVIPEGAAEVKLERTRTLGAEIVRCANSSDARERTAQHYVDTHGYTLVPPYDHPWIIAGQGTVGLEIARDLKGVKNVLVCVGGGGLMAGVATALAALCPNARIIGVEPELAADAAASFAAGKIVRWDATETNRTIADGVRSQSLGKLTFDIIRRHVHSFVTVTEDAIREAVRWYALHAKLVVEPTGALTLAAYHALCNAHAPTLQDGPTVLLVSGGNIAPGQLAAILSDAPL